MLTEFVLLYMSTYRSYLYFCSICTIIYHRNKLSLYHSLEKKLTITNQFSVLFERLLKFL